jgi:hypothetical protein
VKQGKNRERERERERIGSQRFYSQKKKLEKFKDVLVSLYVVLSWMDKVSVVIDMTHLFYPIYSYIPRKSACIL